MEKIAIEGVDGSGKSTIINALELLLTREGRKVATYSPYKEANAVLGHDIYKLWQTDEGAIRAIELLTQLCEEAEKKAEDRGMDILLFDRQWMTAFSELLDRPHLMQLWQNRAQTAMLRVQPDVASRRITNDRDSSWSTLEMQQHYAHQYEKVARHCLRDMLGIYRNDGDVSPGVIAKSIVWDMNIRR